MELTKKAQDFDVTGGIGMPVTMMPGYQPNNPLQSQDQAYADDQETVYLELESPEGEAEEIVFTLPKIPGTDDDSDIIVEQDGDGEIEVEEPKDVEVAEQDAWNWQSRGLKGFLGWLSEMMKNVPRHSNETVGLERCIAYFEAVDKEITKAMRMDYRNEIDVAKAEQAREEIEHGLERLIDRLEKVRTSKFKRHSKKVKKADVESDQIIKEAGTAKINGISITVPLFISFLARTLVNGHVSAGHDMEDMFKKLDKKYKLTDREKAELIQLLLDMNFPLRLDRGLIDEDVNQESSNNFDWAANYTG